MKFPFVSRSRHEAESARWREKSLQSGEKAKQLADKLHRNSQRHAAEKQRSFDLEKLCEARLRHMEHLQAELATTRQSRLRALDELSRIRMAISPYQSRAIPAIIGIDVEPDARVVALNNPSWEATSAVFHKIAQLRETLTSVADGAPVRFTWFPRADPQVEKANGSATWALEHFAEEWQTAIEHGDEIGLHMHAWRWDELADAWCQDHADEAWVIECVRSSIAAFRKVFGSTPACYRGGDRYLSNAVVRVLEEEGVQLDMTLERMPEVPRLVACEHGTGMIPDGTSIPSRAYRPSQEDFRIPDPAKTTGLVMLPLTSYEHSPLKPWLPNTEFENALDRMMPHSDGASSADLTHLAFVIRSNTADKAEWAHFEENTLSLARRVREGRLVFATAAEAWNQISAP